MPRLSSFRETSERYQTLRFVIGLGFVIGTLLLFGGFALLMFGLVGMLMGSDLHINPAIAGVALLYSLGFFAAGFQILTTSAILKLAIHVEENTRHTAQCLDLIQKQMAPNDPTPGVLFRS